MAAVERPYGSNSIWLLQSETQLRLQNSKGDDNDADVDNDDDINIKTMCAVL